MPRVSRESADEVIDAGMIVDRHSDLDGYTVSFLTFNVETDGTELLRGLPNDMCQCPHWGYVFLGRVGFRSAGSEEWYEAKLRSKSLALERRFAVSRFLANAIALVQRERLAAERRRGRDCMTYALCSRHAQQVADHRSRFRRNEDGSWTIDDSTH